MGSVRLDALASSSGGRLLCGSPGLMVGGCFSDTRAAHPGKLFIALRGENFDGNNFVREAVEKCGAVAVLCDRPEAVGKVPAGAGAILVNDTREGYLGIAACHRQEFSALRWIGVTGSVGKSSTKEMLAHLLTRGAGWNVHKARASFNNAVGLSQTVLGVHAAHQAVVLEIGTNHPGEIRQLSAAARPQVAVITCAAESHLEAFSSILNVAREKAAILAFQNPGDTAVLNADDAHFALWKTMARGNVLGFGLAEDADVRATILDTDPRACCRALIRYAGFSSILQLNVPGRHQVYNALAAIAAALACGVRLDAATEALESFTGLERRFTIFDAGGATLIDDAYNANPTSFRAALQTLKSLNARRRFVIAGDMLELGGAAEESHRALGRELADCGLSALATVGPLAALAGKCSIQCTLVPRQWLACTTPEEAAEKILALLQPGDAVLVKGSHGMQLEKAVAALKSRSPAAFALSR